MAYYDSFVSACSAKNFKEARRLLSLGVNPSERDVMDNTGLHFACRYDDLVLATTLIEHYQCDKECKNMFGRTPLHWACMGGCLEVTRYLISELHCNPQCVDKNGRTPLHWACWGGHLEVARYLTSELRCDPHCKNNQGQTPLHLACERNRTNVGKLLIALGCDPNSTDKYGRTPLSLTDDTSIIRELLLRGANPTTVFEHTKCGDLLGLPEHSRLPPESAVKMFIVGDMGAGKSSLTAALKKESKGFSRLASRLTQVSGVEQKTAGIIPHEIASEKFGRLTLYDLAGHKEFYASHDTVLRSTMTSSSTAVFLLVADLAKNDEEFRTTILYWLAFLENQCTLTGTKPHIVIIGSHADVVSSKVQKDKKAIIDSLASGPTFSSFYLAGFIAIDCRYSVSSSMSDLRKCLAKSCKSLRDSSKISFQSHCFLVYLLDKFRDLPAVSLGEVLSHIQQHSGEGERELNFNQIIPYTTSDLYQSCEELNKRGNLLFLGNVQNPPNSWLVLDKEVLLTHVTGSVFAPERFRQHHKLASNTGVVPLSAMVAHFPSLDPDMIACFLSHLDFCHEITDHSVLQLLQSSSSSTQEKYYFFSVLISTDVPPEVWKDASKFSYHSAWLLQCSQSEQFFMPRFLPVLLLRLAFSFALAPDSQEVSSDLPALQRKCSVWKNGIYWRNRQGVEALVEVGEDSQSTTVMVRSLKGKEISCIHLRSALLQIVLKTHKQFCPQVTTSESFIHPDDALSYPLQLKQSSCTTTEIARAVAEGAPCILTKDEQALELETLLHFEPYAHLGEAILMKLFNESRPDYTKLADAWIIEHISHNIKPMIGQSRVSLGSPAFMLQNLISKSHSNITYRDLRAVLDQFSVFAGRNPLELSGQLSLVPTDATETQAKQHPLTSTQGDDSTEPAHPVSVNIQRKSNKPRLYELQRLRGREGSVIKVIKTVAHRWDEVAIALHFNHEEKAAIQRNTFFHDEAACEEVLGEWLSGGYRIPVTWNTLLEALRDCDFTVLARDLENALP